MPVDLAGTPGVAGQLAGHFGAALLSGRAVVVVLIAGAIFVIILAVPVLSDVFLSFASAQGAKVAKQTFIAGACILLFGLAIHVEVIDFVGGGLMGAVILGIILDNY